MSDVMVVYVTAPDAEAGVRIGRAVVDEALAACCNVLPGVRSIYRWQGEVHEDAEVLLVIKTTADRMSALTERVVALHPYDLPEVIGVAVTAGHAPYLDWVRAGSGG